MKGKIYRTKTIIDVHVLDAQHELKYIEQIPVGTLVKVVMESRFGDVGITRNLKANGNSCMGQGYEARVQPSELQEI